MGITYIRALVAVPATLHLARSGGRPAARGYDVMFGSGAALVSTLMALAVGLGLVSVIGLGALAGGAFVGLYAFRSYLRIVLVAQGRSQVAALSDVVYALAGFAFILRLLNGQGVALLDRAFPRDRDGPCPRHRGGLRRTAPAPPPVVQQTGARPLSRDLAYPGVVAGRGDEPHRPGSGIDASVRRHRRTRGLRSGRSDPGALHAAADRDHRPD